MPQIAANPEDIELRANVWWVGPEKAYPAEALDLIKSSKDPVSQEIKEGYIILGKWLTKDQLTELKEVLIRDTTFSLILKMRNACILVGFQLQRG
jgi:hypothetical protein